MMHEICKLADVPTTGSRVLPFFGREVHVYRAGNEVHAVANTCLHFGGPLECKGDAFVCGWHGASFDRSTGERLGGPAPKASRLMRISTRVEGDALYYVWEQRQ